MRALTKELFFRLTYSVIYFIGLVTVYYFSYGWQCEYVSAQFRYHQQGLDYCYNESLLKFQCVGAESKAKTMLHMPTCKMHADAIRHGAQCWNDLFLGHSTYFYGIECYEAINSLLIWFMASYGLGWLLFCAHGWVCEGQIHGRLTRQIFIIWATAHGLIISFYLTWVSLNKELSIETLDSELISIV